MMKRILVPHWIIHPHLFHSTEYECSECKRYFAEKKPVCPYCFSRMDAYKTETDHLEEDEEMDWMMDEDED